MTPETLFLAAVGFALIVGGACLVVLVVERRQQRYLREFYRAAETTRRAVGEALEPGLRQVVSDLQRVVRRG